MSTERRVTISRVLMLVLLTVFFSSCGIPNPLPDLTMSVTDTLACDLPESDFTSDQEAEFNQQNDLHKTADTTSGFTIYYAYSETEDVDSQANRYMRKAAVLPEGQSAYVTSAPNLKTAPVDESQDEIDLFGTVTYTPQADDDDQLIVKIYSDTSRTFEVLINGQNENYLYQSSGSYDSLFVAEEGNNFLHLYIEYYVFDENYNPSFEFSSLRHLGYIRLEE